MRCHYLKDGSASFAFTIGRAEYFVPVGVLLKCFLEASDRELFGRLIALIPQDPGAVSLCFQPFFLFPFQGYLFRVLVQGDVASWPGPRCGHCVL